MKADRERSDEFWEGIDEIPKRNRYEEPANQSTSLVESEVMHVTDGEELNDMHIDEYKELVRKKIIKPDINEQTGLDEYHQARIDKYKERSEVERSFKCTFSWAYDNAQGSRHSKTQIEYVQSETVLDGQNMIDDRLRKRFPNCDVSCILPIREN